MSEGWLSLLIPDQAFLAKRGYIAASTLQGTSAEGHIMSGFSMGGIGSSVNKVVLLYVLWQWQFVATVFLGGISLVLFFLDRSLEFRYLNFT